jgi:hypothetical protein
LMARCSVLRPMRHALAASLIDKIAMRYTCIDTPVTLHLTWSALQGASGSITGGNRSYGNKSFRKLTMKIGLLCGFYTPLIAPILPHLPVRAKIGFNSFIRKSAFQSSSQLPLGRR